MGPPGGGLNSSPGTYLNSTLGFAYFLKILETLGPRDSWVPSPSALHRDKISRVRGLLSKFSSHGFRGSHGFLKIHQRSA